MVDINKTFSTFKPIIPNYTNTKNDIKDDSTVESTDKQAVSVDGSEAIKSYASSQIQKNDLKVDITGVDNSLIDKTDKKEGLDLDQVFVQDRDKASNAINRLNTDKNKDGEWLKWIDLPDAELKKAQEIQDYVEQNVRNKFSDVVVLGIGGSSNGAKTLINSLNDSEWNTLSSEERKGYPKIHFVENIDPDHYSEVVDKLDLKKTLVLVVSKSGKTPETSSTFLNLRDKLENTLPPDEVSKHIVAIADGNADKSVLKAEAVKNGYKTFEVPEDVCGGYSVFSDVGMVPAAMVGIDIKELLKGASDANKSCLNPSIIKDNPATNQAIVQYELYHKGKEHSVIMPYSDKLSSLTDWYSQLWAESLGKTMDKDGQTIHLNYMPMKAIGALDQHSQLQMWREGKNDKVFTIINVKDFNKKVDISKNSADIPDTLSYMKNNSINNLVHTEAQATQNVLMGDKRPVINITMPKIDAYNLGKLMQTFMIQTAIVGEMEGLGKTTYLQPGVSKGKEITAKTMEQISKQNTDS